MIDKTGREIYQFYITKILNFCYIFVIIIPKISAIWYIIYKLIVYAKKGEKMGKFNTFLSTEFNKKNISQNKFAQKLGISSFYLGQLLKGEKSPPDRELQTKILNELDLSKQKKNKYYDLIAKEKNDIPTDIYQYILNNPDNWDEIRKEIERKNEKWAQTYKQKQI